MRQIFGNVTSSARINNQRKKASLIYIFFIWLNKFNSTILSAIFNAAMYLYLNAEGNMRAVILVSFSYIITSEEIASIYGAIAIASKGKRPFSSIHLYREICFSAYFKNLMSTLKASSVSSLNRNGSRNNLQRATGDLVNRDLS